VQIERNYCKNDTVGAMPETICPSAELVGCCKKGNPQYEDCYYGGDGSTFTTMLVQEICVDGGFSTTP
jgi:hypothetical protein